MVNRFPSSFGKLWRAVGHVSTAYWLCTILGGTLLTVATKLGLWPIGVELFVYAVATLIVGFSIAQMVTNVRRNWNSESKTKVSPTQDSQRFLPLHIVEGHVVTLTLDNIPEGWHPTVCQVTSPLPNAAATVYEITPEIAAAVENRFVVRYPSEFTVPDPLRPGLYKALWMFETRKGQSKRIDYEFRVRFDAGRPQSAIHVSDSENVEISGNDIAGFPNPVGVERSKKVSARGNRIRQSFEAQQPFATHHRDGDQIVLSLKRIAGSFHAIRCVVRDPGNVSSTASYEPLIYVTPIPNDSITLSYPASFEKAPPLREGSYEVFWFSEGTLRHFKEPVTDVFEV